MWTNTSWFPLFRTAKISRPFQYFYRPPRSCGKVIFTVCKGSCGKVMFLHLSLSHSVHEGGGVVVSASVHAGIHPLGRPPHDPTKCMLGYTPPLSACWNTHTHPAQCMLDTHNPPLPSAWWDTHPPTQCMVGYIPPSPRRPLQRTVRILLECILVFK